MKYSQIRSKVAFYYICGCSLDKKRDFMGRDGDYVITIDNFVLTFYLMAHMFFLTEHCVQYIYSEVKLKS